MPKKNKLIIITYLIYIVIWYILCLGGSIYLIIKYDKSAWLLLLGGLLCCICFKPYEWYGLFNGVKPKDEDVID